MSIHEPTLFDQVEAGVAPGGMSDVSPRASSERDGGGSALGIPRHVPVGADPANGAPAYRYADPDTSQAAAESVRESAPNDRAVILEALRSCGGQATCDQLRHMLAQQGRQRDRNVVSRRITDLRDRGLVRDSGRRSTKGNGRPVVVWEVAR